MNALVILLTGAALAVLYYVWSFGYWKKRGVNTLKPNLLFGNLSDVILRKTPVYRIFKEVYATCKLRGDKYMGFYSLNKPAIVIVDPELVKNVLAKDFSSFTDRPFYQNEKDPFSVHIASARGPQWKKMREQLSPAFSPSKLKNLCYTLLKVGDQLKAVLDKHAENCAVVDLKDVSSRYIADAVGMNIFGIECNTLQNSNKEFLESAEQILGGSFTQIVKLILTFLCPSILQLLRIPFTAYETQKFYLDLVKSTVEYREKNNVVREDLMHSLIQLRNNIDIEKENHLLSSNISESEKLLRTEEITAQAVVFFGAAYDTSAATISLCVYELAVNEDVQNTLRNEITSVLGDNDEKVSYDAIMKMTYLDKCISETLRKYALLSIMVRLCTKEYKLPDSDVVLDVGTMMYIPIYEIHADPDYYPDPEKFDPERFSPENKLKRPNYTFLAFGEGQRNCIGARLGLLKIKIFLVTLLKNYNFTINSKTELPPALDKSHVVVCHEKPLYLNVEKI